MRIQTTYLGGAAVALLAMLVIGCRTAPKTEVARQDLESDAQNALSRMLAEDKSLQRVIDNGRGYAIFPNAGKGAFVVGGGYGRGAVYQQGRQIGFADLTQLSVGPQVGGQAFSQLIVFLTEDALDRFKNNRFAFSANASAVIVKAGAGATATSQDGAVVFIMPKAGAMAELSISGQRYTYTSAKDSRATTRPAQRASGTEGGAGGADTGARTTETRTEIEAEQRRNTD